jgi:hypothetical protein
MVLEPTAKAKLQRKYGDLGDFTTYALMLQCALAAEVVQITASFDGRIVERWLVEKMLSQFSFVLQQMQRSRCARSTS